jgi:sulfur-oxidizing protein SoxY
MLAVAGAGCVSAPFVWSSRAIADEEAVELVERLIGTKATESDRVHLVMPRSFPNGYTVPLSLSVDSPMTETDHVRHIRVLAPRNPIIEVAQFNFTPQCSVARVSTRIRLAGPQLVLAVAEMNDGAFLMSKAWVEVATNGCA